MLQRSHSQRVQQQIDGDDNRYLWTIPAVNTAVCIRYPSRDSDLNTDRPWDVYGAIPQQHKSDSHTIFVGGGGQVRGQELFYVWSSRTRKTGISWLTASGYS